MLNFFFRKWHTVPLKKRELRNQGRKKEIEQLYQEAARDDLSIEDKKGIAERIDMLQQLLNKPMKEIVLRKRREKREEGMKKEKKKSKEKKKDGEVKEEKKKDGNEKEEGPVAAVESKVSEELLKCEECYYKTYLKVFFLLLDQSYGREATSTDYDEWPSRRMYVRPSEKKYSSLRAYRYLEHLFKIITWLNERYFLDSWHLLN